MGIEILSFTIKDVFDDVDYLNSLGRPQIAKVKRDANIGVAEAERDAGIIVSGLFISWLSFALCFMVASIISHIKGTQIINSTHV